MDKTLKKKGSYALIAGALLVSSFGWSISASAEIIESPILNNTGFIFGNRATSTDLTIAQNLNNFTISDGYGGYYWNFGFDWATDSAPNHSYKAIVLALCSVDGVIPKENIELLGIPNTQQVPLNTYNENLFWFPNKDIQPCGVNNTFDYYTFGSDFATIPSNYQFMLVNSSYTSLSQLTRFDVPQVKWRASSGGLGRGITVFAYNNYYGSTYYIGKDYICGLDETNRNSSTNSNCPYDGTENYDLDFFMSTLNISFTDTSGSGGTSTPPDLPEYPAIEYVDCGITSGELVLGCIKNAFTWATYVPQENFQQFYDLMDKLKKKPPMGYFTAYSDIFNLSSTSSTSTLFILVADNSVFMQYIFTPLRAILVIVMFVFASVWFFRRVKDITI